MQTAIQFSVSLVNKPGVLAHVCDSLAKDKVNIIALSMMDSNEHGVMRMVTEDPKRTREAVKRLNLPTAETEVLMVELPNRPGALADICSRLATGHIAIHYAYCTGNSLNGRSLAILKVSDLPRALQTLEVRKPRRKLEHPQRRPRMTH